MSKHYDYDYEPPGYVDVYQPIPHVGSAYRSYDKPSPYKVGKYTIPYQGPEFDKWLGHHGPFYAEPEPMYKVGLQSAPGGVQYSTTANKYFKFWSHNNYSSYVNIQNGTTIVQYPSK